MTNQQAPVMPAVGSFVAIPFGASATQIGHVVGYTKSKRIKVRAWNATQGRWMPNFRTMSLNPSIVPTLGSHLPAPPAI